MLVFSIFKSCWSHVRAWQERATLGRELAAMSDRELADMGLSRSDIQSVLDRSFRAATLQDPVAANASIDCRGHFRAA